MEPSTFQTKIHEISVLDAKRNLNVIILDASRKRIAIECIHFRAFSVDPSNFRLKIHEISMLDAKCYRDVTKSVPNTKIHTFCKVLPGSGQNANFYAFSKGTDRGFSRIFADFAFFIGFVHGFERFQVAQCFQMRSFSCIFYGSEQFSCQNR